MITQEKNPMEYYVGLKNICPYCRNKLNIFDNKNWEGDKNSSYDYCIKCDKIFETTLSLMNNLIGVKVRQLSEKQKENVKKEFKKRFEEMKKWKTQ